VALRTETVIEEGLIPLDCASLPEEVPSPTSPNPDVRAPATITATTARPASR